MELEQLRLELVKLTHHAGRSPDENLSFARKYLEFIVGKTQTEAVVLTKSAKTK